MCLPVSCALSLFISDVRIFNHKMTAADPLTTCINHSFNSMKYEYRRRIRTRKTASPSSPKKPTLNHKRVKRWSDYDLKIKY